MRRAILLLRRKLAYLGSKKTGNMVGTLGLKVN